jgi:hypothetical protein
MVGIPQRSPQEATKGENGDARMDTLGWLSLTIELEGLDTSSIAFFVPQLVYQPERRTWLLKRT